MECFLNFYTFIGNNIKNYSYYYLCELFTHSGTPGLAQLVERRTVMV